MSWKILKDLGIENRFDIQINTLGTKEIRAEYAQALKNFFYEKIRYLSPESQDRLERNPLRILDSKDEDDQIICSMAPKLQDFLDEESKQYYENVKSYLDELGVPYFENSRLVRGLDYYTDTVFEFWDRSLGAQNAIGGGGRYDGLAEELGGKATPSVGCAFGVERVIGHLIDAGIAPPTKDKMHVFIAQLGEEAKKKAMKLIADLREEGIHTMGAIGKSSMKAQLKMADKFEVDWTIIIGEVEVREGNVIIRDMEKGKQEIVKMEDAVARMKELVGEDKLDTYTVGE